MKLMSAFTMNKFSSMRVVALLMSGCLMGINADYSYAGGCGVGHITQILEGGWNTDDFRIKIDYTSAPSGHPGTEEGGFIAYDPGSLSSRRLSGIKALALAAYMSGKRVVPYSHNNDCSNATELAVED